MEDSLNGSMRSVGIASPEAASVSVGSAGRRVRTLSRLANELASTWEKVGKRAPNHKARQNVTDAKSGVG